MRAPNWVRPLDPPSRRTAATAEPAGAPHWDARPRQARRAAGRHHLPGRRAAQPERRWRAAQSALAAPLLRLPQRSPARRRARQMPLASWRAGRRKLAAGARARWAADWSKGRRRYRHRRHYPDCPGVAQLRHRRHRSPSTTGGAASLAANLRQVWSVSFAGRSESREARVCQFASQRRECGLDPSTRVRDRVRNLSVVRRAGRRRGRHCRACVRPRRVRGQVQPTRLVQENQPRTALTQRRMRQRRCGLAKPLLHLTLTQRCRASPSSLPVPRTILAQSS